MSGRGSCARPVGVRYVRRPVVRSQPARRVRTVDAQPLTSSTPRAQLPSQLEEFRRVKERRAATPRADDPTPDSFTPSTLAPIPSARRGDASPSPIVPSEARGRRGPELARRLRRARAHPSPRAAHDLDGTLDGTPDECRASPRVIRALRDEADRLRRDAVETSRENERLRGEVKHLEDLVDGLVRLLEGVDAAVVGDRPETTHARKHANHKNIVSDTSNGPSNGRASREGVGLAVRRVGRSGGGDGAAGPAGVRAGRNPRGVVGGNGDARHRAHRTRAPVRYGGRSGTRVGL